MFALSAVGANPASAQETTGSISGTVTTTNGFPLDNVFVEALSPNTGALFTTTTAADGTYTLNGVSPDNYSLWFITCSGSFFCGEADAGAYYGGSVLDTVSVTAGSTASGIDGVIAITPSIVGTVTAASNGQPLDDAVVTAYSTGDNFVEETSTGPDGEYMLTNLPDGSYNISFLDCGSVWPFPSTPTCQYAPETYTGKVGGTPWAYNDSSITPVTTDSEQMVQNVNAALYAVTSPWSVCAANNTCESSPPSVGMTVTGSAEPDPDADFPNSVLAPTVVQGGSLQFVPTDLSGGQFTVSQLPSGMSFDTSTGILTTSQDINVGSSIFRLAYVSPSGQEAFASVELNVDWNEVPGQVSGPAVVGQSSTADYTVTAGPAASTTNGPALLSSAFNGPALAVSHAAVSPGKIQNGKVVVTDGRRIVCTELIKNNKARCLIRGGRLGHGHQRLKFRLTASNSLHPRVIFKMVNVKK
jgi:hypothetical protein